MLQEERREEGDVNVAIAFVDRCFVGFLMLLLFALGVVLRVLNIDDVVGDTLLVADIIIFLLSLEASLSLSFWLEAFCSEITSNFLPNNMLKPAVVCRIWLVMFAKTPGVWWKREKQAFF